MYQRKDLLETFIELLGYSENKPFECVGTFEEVRLAVEETIKKEDAIGRISAEVVAECPPGIFVLAPGELITEEHLPYLKNYKTLKVLKEI